MNASTISPHSALVYVMVIVSAADGDMTDSEMKQIGEIARNLPAFRQYNPDNLIRDAQTCADILSDDEGLETVLGLAAEALPKGLNDLAYALACEIAVADEHIEPEELRILELIRHRLGVSRLTAAAIEKSAAVRSRKF